MSLSRVRIARCVDDTHLWILSDRFFDLLTTISERWHEFVPMVRARLKNVRTQTAKQAAIFSITLEINRRIFETKDGVKKLRSVGSMGCYLSARDNQVSNIVTGYLSAANGYVCPRGVPVSLFNRVWQSGNILLPKFVLRTKSRAELLYILGHEHFHRAVELKDPGLQSKGERVWGRLRKCAEKCDLRRLAEALSELKPVPQTAAELLATAYPGPFSAEEMFIRVCSCAQAKLDEMQPNAIFAFVYYCEMLKWCKLHDTRLAAELCATFSRYLRLNELAKQRALEDYQALRKGKYC